MNIPGDRAIALPISQGFGRKIPDRCTPSAGKNVKFDSGFKVWQTLQNALQNAENLFFLVPQKATNKNGEEQKIPFVVWASKLKQRKSST